MGLATAIGLGVTSASAQVGPPQGPPGAGPAGGPGDALPAPLGRPERRMQRPPRGPQLPPRDAVDLSGTIDNYNLSPRGDVDGFILKTADRTVQVNLPPGLGVLVTQQATVGSQVKVKAFPVPARADHSVYVLVSLSAESGKEIKVPMPGDRRFMHEAGNVKNLNYSRNGEVDGVVLSTGDLVHIGPGASNLKLTVGQKLTVDGFALPAIGSDHQAIEAVAIDQRAVERPRPAGPDGSPPPPGARRPGGAGIQGPGGPPDAPPPGPPPAGPRGARRPPVGDEPPPGGPTGDQEPPVQDEN
jgi:hypothetical protein